jgi:hypothetical protein
MATKAKIKELKTLRDSTRRFVLNRIDDETGNSGQGVVAIGTQYPNGHISLTWLSHLGTYAWYDSMMVVMGLHGHNGKTEVIWLDKEANNNTTTTAG